MNSTMEINLKTETDEFLEKCQMTYQSHDLRNRPSRRKRNPPTLLVAMLIGTATMQKSLAVSQKTENSANI